MVPRVAHFLSGHGAGGVERPFSFVHLLALRSFLRENPGWKVFLHARRPPEGPCWELAREHVEAVVDSACPAPDALRLRLLDEVGGACLGLDTLTVRSFEALREAELLLGSLPSGELSARVALASAGSELVRRWRREPRDAEPSRPPPWLAASPSSLLTRLPPEAFYVPDDTPEGFRRLFLADESCDGALVLSLWEERFCDALARLNEHNVATFESTYCRLARRLMSAEDRVALARLRRAAVAGGVGAPGGLKLNVGCGAARRPGYVGVDQAAGAAVDVVCDVASERWPFDDSTVSEVLLHHVLEHVGDGLPHLLRELWRVSRDGARIDVRVPHARHDGALIDPTHVRQFLPETFSFFDKREGQRRYMTGACSAPLAHYWEVDFTVESLEVLPRGPQGRLRRLLWHLGIGNRALGYYLDNVHQEICAVLRTRKGGPGTGAP